MVFPSPVAAVLFDMDGLLLDTERIAVAALMGAVCDVGYEMDPAYGLSMIGVAGKESEAMVRAYFGPAFPMEAYDRAFDTHRRALIASGIPLKPGVRELLDYLEARGIPRAVATSSGRRTAEHCLGSTGLLARFSAVVTREDVARTKPHPDPYLKAADLLGVPPAQCIVLEDSHFGIRAAHAAGTMPVMVPDLLAATAEMEALCVAVAGDLHAVRALLAAPNGE
jgi:HAD superfamily hydrolase (TIGR01509 family)